MISILDCSLFIDPGPSPRVSRLVPKRRSDDRSYKARHQPTLLLRVKTISWANVRIGALLSLPRFFTCISNSRDCTTLPENQQFRLTENRNVIPLWKLKKKKRHSNGNAHGTHIQLSVFRIRLSKWAAHPSFSFRHTSFAWKVVTETKQYNWLVL